MNKYIIIALAVIVFMPVLTKAASAGPHAELSVSVNDGIIKGVLKNISSDTIIWHSPFVGDKSMGSSRAIKVQYKLKKSSDVSSVLSHAAMDSDVQIAKKNANGKNISNSFSVLLPQASAVFTGDVDTIGAFLRLVAGRMEDIEKVRFSVHVRIADGAEDAAETEYVSQTPWYVMTRDADKKYVIVSEVE
ncbi:hypothetical protein M2447_001105 [Ereboglobus sp. PH5-10]|uniref:hypothetical protein n=1 Tax=Ereboglobus sp. PH5-10 TaxID=2940629 RepID=UPI002406E09F|nr:hypothetical protein [Ereboglobus sp. PH5-10]MDF9827020.1 hypothetical protein [Ereboglobus sp. PH5-10]